MDDSTWQILAGLALGFVVFAAIILVAPATGASITPVRARGPMLFSRIVGGHDRTPLTPTLTEQEIRA